MDSIGATVYTMRGKGSSDCTLMHALPCETSDCTAPILGVVRLASSIGVRVVRRELGGPRAVLAPGVLFVSA